MLPFFSMRYRNSNMTILQPHIEKMKRGELTLEAVLEEDEIIQDLKTNPNSQFIEMLSSEAIRKLIDYSTKMPKSDDKNIGYKYPFNATEILCCDNSAVIEKVMHEIKMGGNDSDDSEDGKEEGEKDNKEEENDEFFDVKEDENKGQEPEVANEQEEPEKKNEENPQEESPKEEPKKEEPINEENQKKEPPKVETKQEEPKKEEEHKEETKPEEEKKEEPKKEEEHKQEETNKEEEHKDETKSEETKKEETQNAEPQAKEAQANEVAQKEEQKKEGEGKLKEEIKKEEVAKEEQPRKEPLKQEETTKEEQQKEEPAKQEEPKKEEEMKEEIKKEEGKDQTEKSNKTENSEEQKHEVTEPQKTEEENEKEEPKQEENENQKTEEENEKEEEQEKDDEEQQQKEIIIIYDNVDYLLGFLKESEETKTNYVLVGYFYRILNHLFNSQQSRIIQYLFYYPKKNEFDVLGLMVKNMRRKSMGEIISKLLLFQDDSGEEFLPRKIELLEKVLEELKETDEEDKYECICSTLESTFYNKGFFIEFMKVPKLLELIYSILENTKNDSKKLIAILRLLINIHENILKNEEDRCTISLAPENPMDFLSMFNGTYNLDEGNQKDSDPDLQKTVDELIINLIGFIEKSNLNFMNDLDDYTSKENNEFMSTYQVSQKKLGMKKLTQVEFFRTIIDVLINAYAKFDVDQIRNTIINIFNIAQEKKLFWKMHKIFFDFPFCNLYQSLYLQIIDIILNDKSPNELIEYAFKEKEGENEKNLIEILINKVVNEMQFKYTSGRTSFHPNYSFEVSILIKVLASSNEYLKELINDNKNLLAFDKILGQEINSIFNQKLLLNPEKDIPMGPNIPFDKEEISLKYFGKKNFMELLEEDNSIYSVYLKGEDYETLLSEKKERELIEQEERKKLEEKNYNEGPEEEMVPGLGDSINIVDENKNVEQEEVQREEEEVKEKAEGGNEEEASSETEEEKSYNDVNYWKTEIIPNDNIMSAILNDLD